MERQPGEPTLACTLGPEAAGAQLDEWAHLHPFCQKSEVGAKGARLWFDSTAEVPLRAVAAKEAACCGFLSLEVVGDGDSVRLEITSDLADAMAVIELLATQLSGQPLA